MTFFGGSWSQQPPENTFLPGASAWLNGTRALTRYANGPASYIGSPVKTTIDAGRSFQYLESQIVYLDYTANGMPLPVVPVEATLIVIARPLTTTDNNDPTLISVNDRNGISTLFQIRYDVAQQKFWFQGRDAGENTFFNLYQSGTSSLGNTHVVVATYRNGSQRIYVNGVFQGSAAVSFNAAWTFNFNRVCFGALDRGSGPVSSFEGFIPFGAVYPRLFSEGEIQQLRTPKDVWKLFSPRRTHVWNTATSSGSSGTFTRTNVSDILDGVGTTNILGTFSRLNVSDTLASSGTTSILGSFNQTCVSDILVAAGSVGGISGTFSRLNNDDTLVSSGTTNILGVFSRSNNDDTLVSSGNITVLGTFNRTNNNDVLNATGFVGTPPDTSTLITLTNVGK